MTGRIASLFATPIYVVQAPEIGRLTGALREAITARRVAEGGVSRSNVGGWQSDNDMLGWGGAAAAALAEIVIGACAQITAVTGGRAVAWRPEMWANINRHGDSNQNHWHPGSYLSFVHYVDDGYAGSPDAALGGQIVFVDPRMPYLRMRTPHLRQRDAAGSFPEHETWMRPYSGLLVAFPSFLAHSVRPYLGGGERISIAINMVVR